MHFLYFLYSPSIDKYYVGQSAKVEERLSYHNSDENSIWTKRGKPWILVAQFVFPTKKDALIAERFIKNQKSRKLIANITKEGYRFRNQILENRIRASDPD